jgi:ArsR family transcriptional regulator, virulence genes transcriptional regulator
MADNIKGIAEVMKVLSNENRLMIVCSLLESPMTVSELNCCVRNLSQSALSQHLALLKAHGILDSCRNGLSITYSIHDSRVSTVINVLKSTYCSS